MLDLAQLRKLVARVTNPALFIGGILVGLLGIISLAFRHDGEVASLLLIFSGAGAIAMAQLLELLTDISNHLAAIRAQVGKGVFGLLG